MHKAVFLDRDGTVVVDRAYLDNVEGIELLPGVGEALARLAAKGFLLVLISNQSGVGRGYYSREMVDAQHVRLSELLANFSVAFDSIEICPHAPWDNCSCRKPKPGLLKQAASNLQIDLRRSFMVGDKESDVMAGKQAGCQTIFLGEICDQADWVAPGVSEAVDWIIQQ